MGTVVRVLKWQRQLRLTHLGHGRCRLFSSCGSPCLLLPPGIGIKNNGKDMLLFRQSKEEKIKATGYHHFLDMGKNPRRIRDIEINIRTMWRGRYLSPEKGRAVCVGSSRGWAVFLDRETCDFYLFNFWIKNRNKSNNNIRFPYIPLPPIETLPTILIRETSLMGTWTKFNPEYLSNNPEYLSSIPISETRFLCHEPKTFNADAVSSEELCQYFIKRVALSRAPTPLSYTKKKIVEEEEEEEPMVMIIHGHEYEDEGKGQLAFCRLGDAAWTSLNHNISTTTCFPYKDITYFTPHGKFYALTESQNLEVWDLSCPSSPQVKILKTAGFVSKLYEEDNEENREYYRNTYLVESEGKLLMVIEHYSRERKNWFDVFVLMEPKLEEEEEEEEEEDSCNRWEWMKITSLNGRILFLGINDSVSLPSHEFPGLIPNSIYFASRQYSYPVESGQEAIGVYDLTHRSVSRFMVNDKITPSPTWIFRSNVFHS